MIALAGKTATSLDYLDRDSCPEEAQCQVVFQHMIHFLLLLEIFKPQLALH